MTTWVVRETGLKELRDLIEVQTLSSISEAHQQRSSAFSGRCGLPAGEEHIDGEGSPKGSWEKSASVDLLPGAESALALPTEIVLVGLPA